jgi:hypothetical protein
MNKPELESILKSARLPEIPGESLEMFPRRIVASLKRNDSPARSARNFSPHLAWACGLAACVIIAFAIGHWSGRMETIPATDNLASTTFIRETLAMFPNRLRAIVQDERGINLVLSENADVPISSPLYVHICDGGHCSSLVTFSGQEIQIAGQKVTVLADTHGSVILSGPHFMWSDNGQVYAGGHLKITTKNLGLIPM